MMTQSDEHTIRRINDYLRISGILWIILGVLQIASICAFWLPGPLIGAWNMYAGFTNLKAADRVLARDATIPQQFEGIAGLILIAVFNLVLGGVIGILFVVLDFLARDKILSNRHLFTHSLGRS